MKVFMIERVEKQEHFLT